MNQRLKEAASSGDIDSLYSIIEEDAYVLDRIDQVPFVDSPLHISAAAGQVHFSLEMMRLKPSLAKKLNPKGYSPIHLALQNDQTEIVLRLVDVDPNLVSLQGRGGLTPLHIAALRGKDEVLAKFLVSCPKSIKKLTVRKESALHIAVKNGNTESLKILLGWTRQACINSILNWCDDEGNNIMHLAALENRIEMVTLLLTYNVDIKLKNLEGLTAMDILRQGEFLGDRELKEKLDGGHNIVVKQLRLAMVFLKWTFWFIKRLVITDHREIVHMSKEDRNAILVVSVLIATATYQAILSPPVKDESFTDIKDFGTSFEQKDFGTSFKLFTYFNNFAFVASMIEICLHLPSGIGYTLHLVLPLVICYILLMLFWWEYYIGVPTALVVFVLILSKIPIVRQKISGDLKPKKLIKLGSFSKRNISMERELTEISVQFGRTQN